MKYSLTLNKKGISNIIGYVILIGITISLSILVYNWLSFYVQEDTTPKCPDGISISIEDYSCSPYEMSIKLKNRGRFSIDGYVMKVHDDINAEIGMYEVSTTLFSSEGLSDGKFKPENIYHKTEDLTSLDLYQITLLEIQPIYFSAKNSIIYCPEVIRKKVTCGRNIITENLLLYLPLNESENVKDYSGNNIESTISGAIWNQDGKNNGSYLFDGSDDLILLGKLANSEGAFSFSSWIKWYGWVDEKDTTEISGIWGHEGLENKNSHFEIKNTGMRLRLGDVDITEMQLPPKNQWVHLAFTYNGHQTKIYLNGNKINSSDVSAGFIFGGESHSIGDSHWGLENNNRPFNGLIDEVRIYNRALNDEEIKKLYNWYN